MRQTLADIHSLLSLVPPSQRELFEYCEHARIRLEGHRVVRWQRHEDGTDVAVTIPYANTAFLLLGPGTSISTEAMEALAAANVVVGFTGAASTPLHAGVEPIAFASGQSEYRPTQYMQAWARWWFDDKLRLEKAKILLKWRAEMIESVWTSPRMKAVYGDNRLVPPSPSGFFASVPGISNKAGNGFARKGDGSINAEQYASRMFRASDIEGLLGQEGVHINALYAYFARLTGAGFVRRDVNEQEGVNGFLTMGNYIAYGLAATALHGLGISFAFPVLHGKTRRGALVFDVADPIKDSVIVPLAFLADKVGLDCSSYRRMVKEFLEDMKILAVTMKKIKEVSG